MEFQNDMFLGSEPSPDFVPHDRIRDTILRIENLKAANANTCSFLPSWVNDTYFTQLYTTTETKSNALETTTERVDKRDTLRTAEPKCSIEELDTKSKDVSESTVLKLHSVVTIEKSLVVEKTENNSDPDLQREKEYEWQKKHACLMIPILKELKEKTKEIRSKLDKTKFLSALKPALKIPKFIPRKLFLSSIETFKLVPEPRDQGLPRITQKETKPVKPNSLQYRFLCTTELSPAEEPRVVARRRTTWRERILRFFGFLKR